MSTAGKKALLRLEAMVSNPERYFAQARNESEVVVRAEMAREKQAREKQVWARRDRGVNQRPGHL